MLAKPLALFAAVALSAMVGAQSWNRSYEAGLAAAKADKWGVAREAFLQAIAGRPDDRSAPTVVPGPATDRKVWKNGSPYSPNFLAAYSLYRVGLKSSDQIEAEKDFRQAASELETLINKDQASQEAFFFLDVIYTRLGDLTKRQASADRLTKRNGKADFRVDTEIVSPEEIAALGVRTNPATPLAGVPPTAGVPTPGPIVRPGVPFGSGPTISVNGNVLPLPDKYALVVGQSASHLSGGLVPYASTDAQRVRDALVNFAGYPSDNVVMLQNVSAAEIRSKADALAARMGVRATLFVYFAGAGANVDGKDYLAGADTETAADTASMLGKTDLFAPFVKKGARVFSFFEVNRPMDANKGYFGQEVLTVGEISQVQSTRPGDTITPTYENDQPIGVFTSAVVKTLANIRGNRVPIGEFGWLLFSMMRSGGSGKYGGGGTQVCTLPQYTHLAVDSKF